MHIYSCVPHQDALELGAVFIGTENYGYSVTGRRRPGRWNWGIAMTTPGRQFIFMCEQEEDQREWLEALREVISETHDSTGLR